MESALKRDLRNYPLYFLIWTIIGIFFFSQALSQKFFSRDPTAENPLLVDGRGRLEELNGRTQTHSLNNGDHEDRVRVFDSKPSEFVASPPISVKAQQKKAG